MAGSKPEGGRALKKKVLTLLNLEEPDAQLDEIGRFQARQVINPLFSFLHHGNERTKWAAIRAMGAVVKALANEDMEAARLIMRRLMWNLNDESGGIGWGSPEAMGEIMAQHEALAHEYSAILISYIRPDGNYLEHEMLQRGVLWGIGRLAHARPKTVEHAVFFLEPFITADDPILRGFTLWIAKALPSPQMTPHIEILLKDDTIIKLYRNEQLTEYQISRLAEEALSALHL